MSHNGLTPTGEPVARFFTRAFNQSRFFELLSFAPLPWMRERGFWDPSSTRCEMKRFAPTENPGCLLPILHNLEVSESMKPANAPSSPRPPVSHRPSTPTQSVGNHHQAQGPARESRSSGERADQPRPSGFGELEEQVRTCLSHCRRRAAAPDHGQLLHDGNGSPSTWLGPFSELESQKPSSRLGANNYQKYSSRKAGVKIPAGGPRGFP